jgi:aminoglycoside phosphotransferase family enzyme
MIQVKPEFYSSLMEAGFFPKGNKITKYQESTNFWIFKTGKKIYKFKKNENSSSVISLEELFCNEISKLTRLHSPELDIQDITLKKTEDKFILDDQGTIPGTPLYYGLSMNQLSERSFLDNIIARDNLTDDIVIQICDFLYRFHKLTAASTTKKDGSAEELGEKLQNLFYQSKKHLGMTITQPIMDMTLHPLERFLDEHRKLLLRRGKKGFIRQTHGNFVPRKISVGKKSVLALGGTGDPLKDRFQDVAVDLADLVVELIHNGQKEFAGKIVARYSKISGDREIKQILPFYQALRCLGNGLRFSLLAETPNDNQKAETNRQVAREYYEQTVDAVRYLL